MRSLDAGKRTVVSRSSSLRRTETAGIDSTAVSADVTNLGFDPSKEETHQRALADNMRRLPLILLMVTGLGFGFGTKKPTRYRHY
jgi:hypothetical protein